MAFWCQRISFVFILFFCLQTLAAQQWQHDELWNHIKNIDVGESDNPSDLLHEIDDYVKISRLQNWQDIEILVMSKKASVYSMLEKFDKVKNLVDKYLPLAEEHNNSLSKLELIPLLL